VVPLFASARHVLPVDEPDRPFEDVHRLAPVLARIDPGPPQL
jgi:hypothetical protein